jgi:hypothetical protein
VGRAHGERVHRHRRRRAPARRRGAHPGRPPPVGARAQRRRARGCSSRRGAPTAWTWSTRARGACSPRSTIRRPRGRTRGARPTRSPSPPTARGCTWPRATRTP